MAPNSYSLATRLAIPHANNISIPQIHLGVYLMSGREASRAVKSALAAGYQAVDSAQMYRNESDCGKAIRDFLADSSQNMKGLKREDIWYTSKLASNSTNYDEVRKSISKSVKTCGLGYIDLFLLHSPYGGKQARVTSWKALEDAVADGEVRVGGVSNFGTKHLEELIASKPKTLPAVNQIEVHPFNTRTDITTFCEKNNILIEAYAPLARASRMKHPVISEFSKKYGCTPAQLMVRWSLQHGYIPLPKSVNEERIRANGQVDAFEIEKSDVERMDGLDEYLVTDWDPTDCP